MERVRLVRDQVLICHSQSRTDLPWCEKLRRFLRQYEQKNIFAVQDLAAIRAGDNRRQAIGAALGRARIAVLLVTPDLFASDFVAETALPTLLKAAAAEGVRILWVAVRPSIVKHSLLGEYQAVNDPKNPLSGMRKFQQEATLVRVAEEIERQYLASTNAAEQFTLSQGKQTPSTTWEYDTKIAGRYRGYPQGSHAIAIVVAILGLSFVPMGFLGNTFATSHYQKIYINLVALGVCFLPIALFIEKISIFPEQHRLRAFGLLLCAIVLLSSIFFARAAHQLSQARKAASVAKIFSFNSVKSSTQLPKISPSIPNVTPINVSKMVYIPKGTFMMGSNRGSSRPPHSQDVMDFFLDETEVTVEQYSECIQAGVCGAESTISPAIGLLYTGLELKALSSYCNPTNHTSEKYLKDPANCVNYDQAATYCNWLGKRLPTEQEWEYAVRGPSSVKHPWGRSPNNHNLCRCEFGFYSPVLDSLSTKRDHPTCPVGSGKDITKLGVRGLGGNVAEWVDGWYCEGGYQAACGETKRVVRGADFEGSDMCDYTAPLDGSHRRGYDPRARAPWVGFRCAKSVSATTIETTVPAPQPLTSPRKPNPPMVHISAGVFNMGSHEHPYSRYGEPVRTVSVPAFWIDKTEVSVSIYSACVQAGYCFIPDSTRWPNSKIRCNYEKKGYANYPMNCVTFSEARQLCKWLNRRLPKKAEWEFAARGKEGFAYPWGNEPPSVDVCWKRTSTCAVGSSNMDKTATGVMDLAGNVTEWLDDDTGCGGGEANGRGAAFHDTDPNELKAARQRCLVEAEGNTTLHWGSDIGFRCAR